MKRIIIGAISAVLGTISMLTILICAFNRMTEIHQYRGNILWFTIYGASDLPNSNSLFAGIPFTIGAVLFLIGLIILTIEYVRADK